MASRNFLMLLWIEMKRCQTGFAALGILAIAIFSRNQGDRPDGVVLWYEISRNVADAHLFIGPLGAAMAVWSVARLRRRGMGDQEQTMPGLPGMSALITTVAVAAWMLLAQLGFFIYCAIPAWRFATWGGPNYWMLLASALSIVACVAVGSVVSWFGRSAIAAPLTIIGMYGVLVYVSDSYWTNRIVRLVPTHYFDQSDLGLVYKSTGSDIRWFCLWLVGAAVSTVGIAMLLRSRSLLRMVVIGASGIVAAASASQVMADDNWPPAPVFEDVEPVCEQASGVEICLHPAYRGLIDEAVQAVNQVAPVFSGLSGAPTSIYQQELREPLSGDDVRIFFYGKEMLPEAIASAFASATSTTGSLEGPHNLTASQCVVGAALTADLAPPMCLSYGAIKEVEVDLQTNEPQGVTTMLDGESLIAQMQEKVESFSTMTPAARDAWLAQNWDDLRAGNITLEDLP